MKMKTKVKMKINTNSIMNSIVNSIMNSITNFKFCFDNKLIITNESDCKNYKFKGLFKGLWRLFKEKIEYNLYFIAIRRSFNPFSKFSLKNFEHVKN